MLGDAECVERDAGVDAAACSCQERGAPAHAEADRSHFAATKGLCVQPLHRKSGIIRRALPVEGVEPPPGLVCLLERYDTGEFRAPKHVGRIGTPAALRIVLCHLGLGRRDAPHLAEDDEARTTPVRQSGQIPVEAAPILGRDDRPLDLYRRCRRVVHLRRPALATKSFQRLCSSSTCTAGCCARAASGHAAAAPPMSVMKSRRLMSGPEWRLGPCWLFPVPPTQTIA